MEEKGYNPLVYRFFCLGSHYRKSLLFTWENLDNAKVAYDKLVAKLAAVPETGDFDEAAAKIARDKFRAAMDNDLNTSLGVTALYDLLKLDTTGATKWALMAEFDTVLSVGICDAARAKAKELAAQKAAATVVYPDVAPELLAHVKEQIEARKAAKANKDYAEADRIRAVLLAEGITLVDTKDGTTFTVNA